MRIAVAGDLFNGRNAAVHKTDHVVIRTRFGGDEGELRRLRVDAAGGVTGNGGLLGVALVARGGHVRPLALRACGGRLHPEGINAVVVQMGGEIRGRGRAAVDDDHVAVIAAVAEKLNVVGFRAGYRVPHGGRCVVDPGDRGGLGKIYGNGHSLDVAHVPGGVNDHEVYVHCFGAETGEIDLRFAGGNILHVCRGEQGILRGLLAADGVVDLAGLVGGEGHGAVGSVRAARALLRDDGRGLIYGKRSARFRPGAGHSTADSLHLEGVDAGFRERKGIAVRIGGGGGSDLRAVLEEPDGVGRSARHFRPRSGIAVFPGESRRSRQIERHGHGPLSARIAEIVLRGEADLHFGAVGKAGKRENIVLALCDRHRFIGDENVGGIIIENIVERAVLAGDEGDRGSVLRSALDAVFLDRDSGTRRVTHDLAAHGRPRADRVRADGTDLKGVSAVVLHHAGKIDRGFGDFFHRDGIAVDFTPAVELHIVLGRSIHAGPCRHLLTVLFLPEGSFRRGEHRRDGSLRHGVSRLVAEAVFGGDIHGVLFCVELFERERVLTADELGLVGVILQNVRHVVQLVVVCTGLCGVEGDGSLGLRGAHGGSDRQHRSFAVINDKLFHIRGESGVLRNGCAAGVGIGAILQNIRERKSAAVSKTDGADAALDRPGGDLQCRIGSACQIDADIRIDRTGRVHGDTPFGSADNGLHAERAAGDADIAGNIQRGALDENARGTAALRFDGASALERQTAALHKENG